MNVVTGMRIRERDFQNAEVGRDARHRFAERQRNRHTVQVAAVAAYIHRNGEQAKRGRGVHDDGEQLDKGHGQRVREVGEDELADDVVAGADREPHAAEPNHFARESPRGGVFVHVGDGVYCSVRRTGSSLVRIDVRE